MQIQISWKTLLAGIIAVLALGLLIRTTSLFLTAGDQAGAATSPPASVVATPPPAETVVALAPTATAAGQLPAEVTPTLAPEPSPTGTATPTVTQPATATPEATAPPASPTPFQPPTREPTPVPQALVIVAQGFGQRASGASYAFVVSNPNPNLLAQNIRYQVAAYDAAGIVLTTDTDTIVQVGPGQQMGVAKNLNLTSNLVITRIEVLLRPGQFVQSPPLQMLAVTNPAFVDGEPPNLTGIIANPLDRDLADLNVVGIAYDDSGVIGGGVADIPFVPAGRQAPISVPVVTSLQATRVEFFAPIGAAP